MSDYAEQDLGPGSEPCAETTIAGWPGSEREAAEWVAACVGALFLASAGLDRLKAAVTEAARNALEGGGQPRASRRVRIRVSVLPGPRASQDPAADPPTPGQAPGSARSPNATGAPGALSARGWGFFLVERPSDNGRAGAGVPQPVIEIVVYPAGDWPLPAAAEE